jgi:hypothetical protein
MPKAKCKRSKDHDPFQDWDIDKIPFVPERAVMPIALLKEVVRVRRERAMPTLEHGVRKEAFKYAFKGKIRCDCCEVLVREQRDLSLRTTLTGHHHKVQGIYRYTHSAGKSCGTRRKSVHCDVLEKDVVQLMHLLSVSPSLMDMMKATCLELHGQEQSHSQTDDFEKRREHEIALWKKHIEDMRKCLMDPRDPMGYEEFKRMRAQAERKIARLEAMISEPEELAIQLEECVDLINEPAHLWEMAEPPERQLLTDKVFEYVSYNLDQQRITDFRLKPAMDTLMVVRHTVDKREKAEEPDPSSDSTRLGTMVCPLRTQASPPATPSAQSSTRSAKTANPPADLPGRELPAAGARSPGPRGSWSRPAPGAACAPPGAPAQRRQTARSGTSRRWRPSPAVR